MGLTKSQEAAINERSKTLLVSAAAGSGKTYTLIKRIIAAVLDTENPTDINRMLIVTFTKATAAELRAKVTKAIKEALAKDPENKRLEKQLYLLPGATISTIDSFCNSILKSNTERFGISPRYRIADPIEVKVLSHTVWSSLIEAAFSDKLAEVISAEDFEELAGTVTSLKNASDLEEVFEKLYEHSKSHELGTAVFESFRDELSEEILRPTEESKYIKFAIRRAHEISEHYVKLFKNLLISFPDEEIGLRAIERFVKYMELTVGSKSYSEIREHLMNATAKPAEKNKNVGVAPELVICRDSISAELEDCFQSYFKFPLTEWQRQLEKLSHMLSAIAAFIGKFDEIFFEEKRRRAILEYSDIERLTYRSLYNDDGTLSDFALSVRGEYDAVYIDEYQDVNAIQNKIFEAISTERNRFMVGDIKQSIYGFRSARPDIFADMKNTFPVLGEDEASPRAAIFMSENFRCDRSVVDFVNTVFDKAFTVFGDSIGYDSRSDKLVYSKDYEVEPERILPEIHLLVDGDDTAEQTENEASLTPSAIFTANKIKELLKTAKLHKPHDDAEGARDAYAVRPADIAILLRKDQGRGKLYADALAAVGIRAKFPDDKQFFFNAEIRLALCLLNAIDNPRRDIYLAGLMLSPLTRFTPDDLYNIRSEDPDKDASLWQSLVKYCAAHPQFERGRSFIEMINGYRAISEGIKVDALLLRLYHKTGLLALAKREGKEENLMLLYNYACKFEASSYEGLYNFIKYINEVIASGASFASAQSDNGEDAVTIITDHKSKGLEYPIVFAVGAETPLISVFESRGTVFYSDEYGIGMKTRSDLGYALVESPITEAIIDRNIEKSLEEELRVNYVALSRAKERLFIVGDLGAKSSREKYLEALSVKKMSPSRQTLRQLKNLADIVMFADPPAHIFFDNRNTQLLDVSKSRHTPAKKEEILTESSGKEIKVKDPNDPFSCSFEILKNRFSYVYPDKRLTVLPEKMSVSKLKPDTIDELDIEISESFDKSKELPKCKLGILPEFIHASKEEESARCGIATHTFLQFFDIELFDKDSPEAELERLVEREFISKENAARVRLDEIKNFGSSALYKEMRNAKKLYREFRFSAMLPASHFTKEYKELYANDEILVQGVIDCIIEDKSGKLHLIDYKTDRLTDSELKDRAKAENKLRSKHGDQLAYYSLAIEEMFGKKPETVRVYSLHLGDTVDII